MRRNNEKNIKPEVCPECGSKRMRFFATFADCEECDYFDDASAYSDWRGTSDWVILKKK